MSLEQAFVPARQNLKTARQRAVFIFTPASDHARGELLHHLLKLVPEAVHFSDTQASSKPVHRYRDELGQTYTDVVLDYQQLIHADALAALTGTVSGGGCLWLILPSHSSAFQARLLASSVQFDLVRQVASWPKLIEHFATIAQLKLPTSPESKFPSAAQQSVIDAMCKARKTTHLLLADRGRGKSTAMGLAIKAAGYTTQQQLLVTAPQPQATTALLKHAEGGARFCAWDRLLQDVASYGSELVIDEAAAIPLHILKQLMNRYSVWAIATTVDGYEGCGKGFALRFLTWLQESTICQRHILAAPLRWSHGDSVEPWLNDLLMLTNTQLPSPPQQLAELQWNYVHASELKQATLEQVITLLLEAHYQSSPNDLRLLLDDAQQQLGLLYANRQLVGVCWTAHEGPIATPLQYPVLSGQRRLKGQLLPQAIGFYRQQQACLNWRWLRIVRIASHPQLLRQGIASMMLSKLIEEAKNQAIDAVGTSFGSTAEVTAFWGSTPFVEIRRGQKINMASGEVSAIWALGLTHSSQHLITQLQQLHLAENVWQQKQLPSVRLSVHTIILPLLRGFTDGYLPLSNVRFAWWYLLQHRNDKDSLVTQPRGLFEPDLRVAELVQLNQFSSRSEFENHLRNGIVTYLLEHRLLG
ncbi:GNAT family N-acetyltransferase [Pseudidiomarina sp. E22-M8]|uniref:GNAT family N-acetyltransferase n=1 Tax=Pseudidiomarina sp. E22-M8 TaxID=3424768 RepID=UPI00403CF132